jgi:ribosomal protein S18 acetylase RimI-like enzyme
MAPTMNASLDLANEIGHGTPPCGRAAILADASFGHKITLDRVHVLPSSLVDFEVKIAGAMSDYSLLPAGISIRTDTRPADVDAIVHMHREIYAREYGFDDTFATYVRQPLSIFVQSHSPRERLWIAEVGLRIIGCVAIVAGEAGRAQLRWYLIDPEFRGRGLGRQLLHDAVAFARACGYPAIYLWTVSQLTAAAHLYQSLGFQKVEAKPGHWGVDVLEEKYELIL